MHYTNIYFYKLQIFKLRDQLHTAFNNTFLFKFKDPSTGREHVCFNDL